jgi:hypothetical protein
VPHSSLSRYRGEIVVLPNLEFNDERARVVICLCPARVLDLY